jgi:calcineurin-like phosphoesterase family protein
MNETEIANWNRQVQPDDTVYVLGDFFLGTDLDFVSNTLASLKGEIHFVAGNHDSLAKINLYHNTPNIVEIKEAIHFEYQGRQFHCSHYPTITSGLTESPEHARFNLFGHTHSNKKFYNGMPFMYNVAVDAHNCCPVSIYDIMQDIDAEIAKCKSFLE